MSRVIPRTVTGIILAVSVALAVNGAGSPATRVQAHGIQSNPCPGSHCFTSPATPVTGFPVTGGGPGLPTTGGGGTGQPSRLPFGIVGILLASGGIWLARRRTTLR